MIISAIIDFIVITIYASANDTTKSFFLPTIDSVYGVVGLYSTGLPISLTVSIEGWSFELQGFLASYLGVITGSSMVVMMNTLMIPWVISQAIQSASA